VENFINIWLNKIKKIYNGWRKLFYTIPKSEIKIRRKLFSAYALPHFFWLFATWFFFTEKQQANIKHVYCSWLRIVYNLLKWNAHTTLALTRETSLRDYILKYWVKSMKHLDESPEGIDFQQTTNSYFISIFHSKIYYKSCDFRKKCKISKKIRGKSANY